MLKSAFYFGIGIALALIALVAIALAVTSFTGDDDEPAPSPAATAAPSVAGPAGPDTQPAPTAIPADPPASTDTPVAEAHRGLDIVTLLPKDAIPAILEPAFLTIAEADEQMTDDELVLGVSIGGDSRAYSVNMLSRHEIATDVVGGMPVAVTW